MMRPRRDDLLAAVMLTVLLVVLNSLWAAA